MAASIQEEQAFLFAVQLSTAALVPMVTKVAIELNLFEIIAKAGPGAQLSPKEIASHLPQHNPTAENMLDRILRLLASHSVLTSSVNALAEKVYGLAPVCKYFVQNEDGVSISPYLLMCHDKVFMDSCYHLTDAILEGGIPFNKAHGMHLFEYPKIDPRFNQVFNNGMLNYTTIFAQKMVETYKGFQGLKDVVDVGGGVGTAVSIITSKYPKVKGINFDLPHVIEHAPAYPGVEHVGGDMFESVPTGEAIFMKWILHDWSDERCSKLLRNCYEALPDSGKLIVVDGILPVAVESDTAAKGLYQIDVGMMALNPGGKERTEEEFGRLGKGAGFERMEKVCCVYYYWVMEFYKM